IFLISILPVSAQTGAQIDFSKQVQPIFTESCVGCHKGANAPAGLQLDTPAGLFKGSASGAVVVPGNSKHSLLGQRIADTTGNQMPPGGPLAKDQIQTILTWIDEGAKAEGNAEVSAAPARPRAQQPTFATVSTAAQERQMIDYYCRTCHPGVNGLPLDKMDTA